MKMNELEQYVKEVSEVNEWSLEQREGNAGDMHDSGTDEAFWFESSNGNRVTPTFLDLTSLYIWVRDRYVLA